MPGDYKEYTERHLAFWSLEDTKRPLIGFTIGAGVDSWSYWKYNKAAQKIFNKKSIFPEDISPQDYVDDQFTYLKNSENIDDDIYRSAMPLASIPWMEAILGCPIISSGEHLSAQSIIDNPDSMDFKNFDAQNLWIRKYIEFLETYSRNFGNMYPVAQSILRGPSDLASALMGLENSAMALLTSGESMHRLFYYITDWLENFLILQLKHIPKFKGGYVIGQYEIWAPKPPIRIQEDSSVFYSPELFDEFLKPLDSRLASISEYTLIHLHSPSLALIDNFLDIENIRAFQVTKDPGGVSLQEMIPSLIKIQEKGKPLIIKGELAEGDLTLIKKQFSKRGLCIQPVVRSNKEAEYLLQLIKNW
jgi:hypothetical protein